MRHSFVEINMERATWQGMQWLKEPRVVPQLLASTEWGLGFYYNKGLKSADDKKELGSRFSPSACQADALISAL